MTLDEIKAELEKCSPEERAAVQAWLEERELEATVSRRIAEADADPSIMVPYEEGMKRIRGNIKKRNEQSGIPSGST